MGASMFRVAVRGSAVAVVGALAITGAAVSASADPAPVAVTLSPAFGPAGTTVDITATTDLSTVTSVTFAGSAQSQLAGHPTTDSVQATVPSDAHTGPLTLTYADGTSAPTDRSFTVQLPTHATIAQSRPVIVFGHSARVSARLEAAGAPVQGQRARLQRAAPHTSDWHNVQTTQVTGSRGRVHWTVSSSAATTYRVVFRTTHAYVGTTTKRTRLAVTPVVSFAAPSVAPILTQTAVHGRVRPAPARHSEVRLMRWADGAWHRADVARTDRRGRYSFSVSLPATGRYAYRVRRPHDSAHRSATSHVQRIQGVQRTLHSGMSGSDVRALQRALRALHYDVGGVTGSFGFDTQHAVVAFQKVQGIARDGVVGTQVWTALDNPRRLHLHHPGDAASAGVEVDLTHQVVIYAVHGRIVRILDSSTGGGYTYTGSDGTQQQAITPTGHFAIRYKRDGWVHAPLGELYRPAYFNYDGYAIHGETEVPSYPASHGCVRITVPAMDRMNAKLYVGMSVWIYRS